MAATILSKAEDLEQVRKALDASLTADELPDSTIQLPYYLEVGEALLIEQVPNWESLTGAQLVYFRAAAVAQVAALLAPAMPGILPKSEEGLTYKVTRDPVDWNRRADTLQQQVAVNIQRAKGQTTTHSVTQMVITGPTRKARSTP